MTWDGDTLTVSQAATAGSVTMDFGGFRTTMSGSGMSASGISMGKVQIQSFTGNKIVYADGTEITCPEGANMSITSGGVYIDGKKVSPSSATKRQRTEQPKRPDAVQIPAGKCIRCIDVSGTASVRVENGGPVSDAVAVISSGSGSVHMSRAPTQELDVKTSGASQVIVQGNLPTKQLTVNTSGASRVQIGP